MSMHHLAEYIDGELEYMDKDEETETDIIAAALDRYVYPILEKTLALIDQSECGGVPKHQVRLLKDEIHDLLEGKFR